MSDKRKKDTELRFYQGPVSAVVITLMSLFCQILNWLILEKMDYPWWVGLITPLMLCAMYHFVQLDAGKENGYSRIFFFIFSAAVPLLLGILLTAAVYLGNPGISTFDPAADFNGTAQEIISLYTGRIAVTSLYVTVFAVIDIPILKAKDKAGNGK